MVSRDRTIKIWFLETIKFCNLFENQIDQKGKTHGNSFCIFFNQGMSPEGYGIKKKIFANIQLPVCFPLLIFFIFSVFFSFLKIHLFFIVYFHYHLSPLYPLPPPPNPSLINFYYKHYLTALKKVQKFETCKNTQIASGDISSINIFMHYLSYKYS